MRKARATQTIVLFLFLSLPAHGQCKSRRCCAASTEPADPANAVLKKLQDKAASLNSYACRLDHTVRQTLLESQQRRTGTLRYAKLDGQAFLRIDFQTLQQDQEKPQPYREEFFFDGVWFWHIDYIAKSAERRQMTEPNKPIDPFALVTRHVPVLGFSKIEEFEKQFDVTLVRPDEGDTGTHTQLHLEVKPDSDYRNDYTTINFWIDKKQGLPDKVVAVTTEQDVHEIRLLAAEINKVPDSRIRDARVPEGFSLETVPLEKKVAQ
jgi:outer membrane lipoprotein-sorting protein